ncbi:hypothetical protein [Streptococcus thoraltensis]|uniref:hypothetical protein n=1 Tax=Streptococcus thoraltensis TaxID=55085 RepID=UPI001F562A7A|nr:hypothetical protein [Streptococcus thoraltensis]
MGLIHLDGDFKNASPENLMEVSVEELRLFHKRHLVKLSPEVTKSEFLSIRLELLLKQRSVDDDKI